MILNELAQWAALIVVTVFVIGLTRQLGYFIRPPEEERSDAFGPELGGALPSELFAGPDRDRLEALFDRASVSRAAVMVTHERCEPCASWLEALGGSGRSVPLIALTNDPSPEYLARLLSTADLTIVDDAEAQQLKEANLVATPFLMLIDRQLRVQEKQLGGDPLAALRRWDPDRNGSGSEEPLEVTRVGGNDDGSTST